MQILPAANPKKSNPGFDFYYMTVFKIYLITLKGGIAVHAEPELKTSDTKAKRAIRDNITGYLMIFPWLFGLLTFTLGPMIYSVYLSFTDFDYFGTPKYIGLENYKNMFGGNDFDFYQSLIVTFKYVFIRQPIMIVFSLAIALLLNRLRKNSGLFRTLFYLPTITGTGVALAVMWRAILQPEGLFNTLLQSVGLQPVPWLSDPTMAFYSLVLTSLYGFGGTMIIFLAGLKNIPESLYESATIDGAGSYKKFTHITIPMLSPVIFFNVIMGLIYGFQTFTNGYVITMGGPLKATLFFMINLYRQAFKYHYAGYASALAWVLFVIILFFTLIVFKSSDTWVYYETTVKSKKAKKPENNEVNKK